MDILTISYLTSLFCGVMVLCFAVSSIFLPFQFWPPPRTNSWQYKLFWILFRLFIFGLVLSAIFDFKRNTSLISLELRLAIGVPICCFGFGLATYWTNFLGWRNAHGEPVQLITDGIYKWSRNPIYVVSIVGIFGFALIVGSLAVGTLLLLWMIIYVVAPFLEEPWLEYQFGNVYQRYKEKVPRFI